MLVTIIILLFGELLPKVIASKHPVFISRLVSIPLYLISTILYPVAEAITEFIRITTSKIKLDKARTAIREHELTDLAELGHERGTIEEEEQDIIASYVEIKSVNVSEVMTPRVDMVAIPADCSYNELVETITETGHSRLPMYRNNLDKIIGIIYAKDLLPYLREPSTDKEISLEKLAREAIFVPEKKKINEMLQEFQEKKMHIAIVVDEYGGTAGLITLEDIIEEVVGEIWDEHDQKEDYIKIISDYSFMVLGKVTITELNETLQMEVVPESENYETIAGLIIDRAGSIPKDGYSFILGDFRFTVKEVLKKRIKTVQIDKINITQAS
jgi:CBS domain containing-hemolysin-like protein